MFKYSIPFFLFLISFGAVAYAGISANYKSGGGVIVGESSVVCDSGTEGAIRYDSGEGAIFFCDGSVWSKSVLSNALFSPPEKNGYFVMSNSRTTGAGNYLIGMDTKCLNDLIDNDWMGKADAVARGLLVSTSVQAFLCGPAEICRELVPGAVYAFAASGYPQIGGARITADDEGFGPGNEADWSGVNYFGGVYEYWTGRLDGSVSKWGGGSSQHCPGTGVWHTNSAAGTGRRGRSNGVGTDRWSLQGDRCDYQLHLICMVHPLD